jgi:hypothetical protein
VQAQLISFNQPKSSMKYATVITTAQEIEGIAPHSYFISPANEEGMPEEGQMGKYARIKFEGQTSLGCNEADVIGILMHRMAAIAQDGEHRNYERAIQCLDAAMKHVLEGQVIEIEPVADMREMAAKTLQGGVA